MPVERGVIENREAAAQIRDFSGLRFGNITPTDIDGLVDYRWKCWVLFELKHVGKDLPGGQRLAFERLVDDLAKIRPAIAFVSEHNDTGDINAASSMVREYYWKGAWRKAPENVTLHYAVSGFLKAHGN